MPLSRSPKVYTLSSALSKVRKYCVYQERAQQEVRNKFYDLGLHKRDVEMGIAQLIEEGFLNEQRFAIAFAGGKFRINKWGKVKIRLALKAKKVSDYCVREALSQIPLIDYKKTLEKILQSDRGKKGIADGAAEKYKLAQKAISKGYERDLVWEILKMDE